MSAARRPTVWSGGVRDLTQRQFAAALARNGFRQELVWFKDTTGVCPNTSIGAILNRDGSIDRRSTLAKIIQYRDAERAKLPAGNSADGNRS